MGQSRHCQSYPASALAPPSKAAPWIWPSSGAAARALPARAAANPPCTCRTLRAFFTNCVSIIGRRVPARLMRTPSCNTSPATYQIHCTRYLFLHARALAFPKQHVWLAGGFAACPRGDTQLTTATFRVSFTCASAPFRRFDDFGELRTSHSSNKILLCYCSSKLLR